LLLRLGFTEAAHHPASHFLRVAALALHIRHHVRHHAWHDA
jgi:hypothetical protein